MITLAQFPANLGLPNASVFCMKVEGMLTHANIEFNIQKVIDPRKTPRGKLPYIIDEEQTISDSSLIVKHLKNKYHLDYDAHLSDIDKARSYALVKMLEEHYYWCLVYSRWVDNDNWEAARTCFFGHLPPVVKSILPALIQKNMIKQLHEQGMGRYTKEEIYEMGEECLQTISGYLGEKPYVMGGRLSYVDFVVLSALSNSFVTEVPSPLRAIAQSYPNLIDYCQRVYPEIFGEAFPLSVR